MGKKGKVERKEYGKSERERREDGRKKTKRIVARGRGKERRKGGQKGLNGWNWKVDRKGHGGKVESMKGGKVQ